MWEQRERDLISLWAGSIWGDDFLSDMGKEDEKRETL